ncbi:MAG TPA: glycosyltransferase family 2 protein [Geminicoccus sp.]|uniref:glycosyltransferase family 2 protein n=1 Tax=Geminicoccus sp. TaxID=2024832 RepID=UPI002B894F80|nr:glycosyltransferase family 2 protein [Geminicoccus sp.]HWL68933.1 glycosyltransferase family 2 protein [Geminicoccus sp.]
MTQRPDREGNGRPPLVSVGIPVFNGENYLDEAIRSVRSQTLTDLELVIADNASTDRTEQICRDHAAEDPRIVYLRNERNLGAIPNYNRTFDQARGRYFKWLAHDDRILPGYLAATTAALEADSSAVLCNSLVEYIGRNGQRLANYESVLADADLPSPSARFATLVLRSHSVVDIFATFRRAAWLGNRKGSFHGEDRAFLAYMALKGRLIHVNEPLNQMREHPNRYTRAVRSSRDRLSWHDTSKRGQLSFPTLRLFAEYAKIVRNVPMPAAERRRCRLVLARWWFTNYNLIRAGVDLASVALPELVSVAENVKTRLLGAAPGHTFVDADRRLAGAEPDSSGKSDK